MLALRESRHLSIKALAASESVAHSTMSRLVSALESEGMARSVMSGVDRRVSFVVLTRRGKSVVDRSLARLARPLVEIVEGFSNREAAELDSALRVLHRVADQISTER
jgi:DNA-binding MarR family transcriptional regulator